MVSPVRGHHRRFQAETPLIALCRFSGPALPFSRQRTEPPASSGVKVAYLRVENPMGQFQPPADPSTVWLRGLIDAMDEVATSAAKPSAADREALATRLELPAMAGAPWAAHPPGKPSSKGLGALSQARLADQSWRPPLDPTPHDE